MTKSPATPGGASTEGTVTAAESRHWIAVPLALAALAWALGATGYRYALARTAARTAEQSWARRLHALMDDVPDVVALLPLVAVLAWDVHVVVVSEELLASLAAAPAVFRFRPAASGRNAHSASTRTLRSSVW